MDLRSSTLCPTGIISMLFATSKGVGGSSVNWQGKSDQQQQVAAMYAAALPTLESGIPDLAAFASFDVDRLNAALAERGYDIQVPSFTAPSIGAVAFYEANIQFEPVGVPGRERFGNAEYASVTMQVGPKCWMEQDAGRRDRPVLVQLGTKGEEEVYLIPCEHQLEGLQLLNFAINTLRRRAELQETDNGVIFPMAHIKHTPDVSWLEGMQVFKGDKKDGELGVALQENSLELNHRGARVKSATAGVTYRSMSKKIDCPYVFVVVRDGMVHFVALLAQDAWRNPSDGNPLVLKDTAAPMPTEKVEPVADDTDADLVEEDEVIPSLPTTTPAVSKPAFAIFI